MPRLFVAVWPPPDIVDAIAAIDRPEIPGLRWTTPGQWHVTLRFLGMTEAVEPVADALAGVRASAREVWLGPAIDRFRSQVLHVPVSGLDDLAVDVVAATAGLGEPPEDRPFRGHITLARVGRSAKVDLRPLAGAPVSGRWRVGEVTVVASELRRAGAHYTVVARHMLGG